MRKRTPEEACQAAVELAGGPAAVGRELGVSPQAVCKWRLIPAPHVLDMARLTRYQISIFEMQPEVFGSSIRELRPALAG